MSALHTQGPWIVVHELRRNDEAVADLVNDTWVIPENGQSLGHWMADARLIAAAPDLLSQLRSAVDHIKILTGTLDQLARLGATIALCGVVYDDKAARAAIAKATGEAV